MINLIWVTNIVSLDGDIYICNHLFSDGLNRGLIYRQKFTISVIFISECGSYNIIIYKLKYIKNRSVI